VLANQALERAHAPSSPPELAGLAHLMADNFHLHEIPKAVLAEAWRGISDFSIGFVKFHGAGDAEIRRRNASCGPRSSRSIPTPRDRFPEKWGLATI